MRQAHTPIIPPVLFSPPLSQALTAPHVTAVAWRQEPPEVKERYRDKVEALKPPMVCPHCEPESLSSSEVPHAELDAAQGVVSCAGAPPGSWSNSQWHSTSSRTNPVGHEIWLPRVCSLFATHLQHMSQVVFASLFPIKCTCKHNKACAATPHAVVLELLQSAVKAGWSVSTGKAEVCLCWPPLPPNGPQ